MLARRRLPRRRALPGPLGACPVPRRGGAGPQRVLELGCGAGQFLEQARRRGHEPVGIDFNPAAAAAARARGLQVVHGGFDRLRAHLARSGDPRPFDAVAIFRVIEHFPDPKSILNGLAEFVRPGTLLGVTCPGPDRFTQLIRDQHAGARDRWDYPPHHVLPWTLPALRTFLGANRWQVVSAEEPMFLRHAAAQIGATRAQLRGYAHRRWRTRWSILMARLRLLKSPVRYKGLSLYVCARFQG